MAEIKRIMRKFTIDEISGVDFPAQEGARALIMKRRDAPTDANKGDVKKDDLVQAITGSTNGHLHGIRIRNYGDGDITFYVAYATSEGDEHPHDHMLYKSPDGTVTVLENAGHTHSIDSAQFNAAIVATVTKSEGDDMTEQERKALEAKAARLESIVKMNAEHRAHFDTLEGDAAESFIAKSAADRDTEIADLRKAQDADDPVVYKSASGYEVRKSDGPAVHAMAKAMDAQTAQLNSVKEENAALKAAGDQESFEKRAAKELPHLPGDIKARASLLRDVEATPDEALRKAKYQALKAQNDSMAHAFMFRGATSGVTKSGDPVVTDTASDKLETLKKAYIDKHPDVHPSIAEARVLATPEGQDLYNEIIEADRVAAREARA